MTRIYKGKRDLSFGILLLIGSLVLIAAVYGLPLLSKDIYSIKAAILKGIIVAPLLGLILWCWIDTNYMIDNAILIARCGPFICRLSIQDITVIRLNQKNVFGIFKPALSWNSIEIETRMYTSILIAPELQDELISELKNINDKIDIR